jgi:hypothetical protein
VQRAKVVHGHHLLKHDQLRVLETRVHRDTCVVDHEVERAESLDQIVDRPLTESRISHIAREHDDLGISSKAVSNHR